MNWILQSDIHSLSFALSVKRGMQFKLSLVSNHFSFLVVAASLGYYQRVFGTNGKDLNLAML